MRFKNSIRIQVYNKFCGRCAYCGREISLKSFQIDHFIPDTSNNVISNLMPSCRSCNFYKSNLSIEDFRVKIYKLSFEFAVKNSVLKLLQQYFIVDIKLQTVVFYFENFNIHSSSSAIVEI